MDFQSHMNQLVTEVVVAHSQSRGGGLMLDARRIPSEWRNASAIVKFDTFRA